MPIRTEIVSQDRIVYQGDADIVVLPGVEGVMGILPNHSPLLTTLQFGIITVRSKSDEFFFTVAGGIAEVQPDQVTVLADAAENVAEIDVTRAEAAKQRAEEMLKEGLPPDQDRYLKIQAALRRSTLRIDAARRYQRGRRS
ncbi:MAG TPA: ATP synthase F1 subunit epsilon [Longilinea sp.]|nr:ATP synthase F1 subunit epsilon [Longilinea sp.]